MKMEMLFSVLPSKGKIKRGRKERGERRRENICLFAINKICSFFVVRKMEMAFKVVKVERIEAWWLRNYSSGSGLIGGGGGGVRPRTDGQINETAGSLLKRSHVITVHQTDRALKLSPLSL